MILSPSPSFSFAHFLPFRTPFVCKHVNIFFAGLACLCVSVSVSSIDEIDLLKMFSFSKWHNYCHKSSDNFAMRNGHFSYVTLIVLFMIMIVLCRLLVTAFVFVSFPLHTLLWVCISFEVELPRVRFFRVHFTLTVYQVQICELKFNNNRMMK